MSRRVRKLSLTFRKDSGGLPRIFSTPSVPFGAADFNASGSCRPPRGFVGLWIAGFWFEAKGLRILFGTDLVAVHLTNDFPGVTAVTALRPQEIMKKVSQFETWF